MSWFRSRGRLEIDDSTIDEIVGRNVVLASMMADKLRARHRGLTSELIVAKRWEPVAGLELGDEVLVTIAANAAIPILELDIDVYRNVQSIIVRPTANVTTGRRAGPVASVVSDNPLSVIGLASPNTGPLSLAWNAALADSRRPETGRNVVIHEFAHKIDMSDGYSDGTPPLRGTDLTRWIAILADEYERAEPRPSDAALRAYAWSSPAEFFAVATEAFFCTPSTLREAKPELYGALVDFYGQEPATR
jgi:Mlc titration factor MtfA (ptsG expression regulator)